MHVFNVPFRMNTEHVYLQRRFKGTQGNWSIFAYLCSETFFRYFYNVKLLVTLQKGYILYIGNLWNISERVLNCQLIICERGGIMIPWTSINMVLHFMCNCQSSYSETWLLSTRMGGGGHEKL